MFSTHKILHILSPFFLSYTKKMIKVSEGSEGIQITCREDYARDVFSRAVSLQNAYDTLNLSMEYLKRNTFIPSTFEFEKHYQYHLEHFYLSLFGLIDRCYSLVGKSIMLPDSVIDKIGSIQIIEKRLAENQHYFKLLDALRTLKSNQEGLRNTRNAIAHKNGVTNAHIEALDILGIALDYKSYFPEGFEFDKAEEIIRNGLSARTEKELELIRNTLVLDIENIFNNLEFIYNEVGNIELMDEIKYEY